MVIVRRTREMISESLPECNNYLFLGRMNFVIYAALGSLKESICDNKVRFYCQILKVELDADGYISWRMHEDAVSMIKSFF